MPTVGGRGEVSMLAEAWLEPLGLLGKLGGLTGFSFGRGERELELDVGAARGVKSRAP